MTDTTHTPTPDTDLWALAGRLHEAHVNGQPGFKILAAAKEADTWARERYGGATKEAEIQYRNMREEMSKRHAAEVERDNWREFYNRAMRLLNEDAVTKELKGQLARSRSRAADLADRLMVVEAERDKLRKRVEELEADIPEWQQGHDEAREEAAVYRKLYEAEVAKSHVGEDWPTVRELPKGAGYVWTDCEDCGADVTVDDEGCCATCGTEALHYGRRTEGTA